MQYTISLTDTCVTVIFEGNLRAIDLIFMNQDPRYKEAIIGKKTIFLDFSGVSGSELTLEDTQGLMLLGKLDSQRTKNMHLIILVANGSSRGMSALCEKIFSDSSWQVTVSESRTEVLELL